MEKISKFKSRKEWFDCAWSKLLEDIKNHDLSAALDALLSLYEKKIIINRFAAVSLIKEGKTYRQIGEELWLSPTTIRSLKRTLGNNPVKEYQSYRLLKNKHKNEERINRKEFIKTPAWVAWVDHIVATFPEKNGSRWKF